MTRRFEHDRAAVRRTEVNIDARSTALVILDPRNRFRGAQAPSGRLEDGLTALVRAARESGVPVFLSPHYYYPVDHGWEFQDSLRRRMDSIGMFRNRGATLVQRAARSGATRRRQGRYWPGAVAGLGNPGLALQLRRRDIHKVILVALSPDCPVVSPVGEFREQGFEVMVVRSPDEGGCFCSDENPSELPSIIDEVQSDEVLGALRQAGNPSAPVFIGPAGKTVH